MALFGAPLTAHSASATYQYDTKGRVSKITYDDGTVVDYTYDANGNRTGAAKTEPPPDTTPPSAPGTPTISDLTMTSAKVSWTAATDNKAVVGYDYRVNSGSWQMLSNVLFVNLTGLSPATAYTVDVRARDAASNLGPASAKSFTTPDTVAPSAPTGLAASAPTSTAVNLSWNASSDNVGVTGYRIYRNGAHIANSSTTTYSDTGRTANTTYAYQVRAYDAAVNLSDPSNTATVTTPDTIAPSAPTGLSASAPTSTTVNLSWNASSDNIGVTGYRIYRNGAHIANSSTTAYSDTGRTANTTYSYQVRAYDAATNLSGLSNTATVTTPDTIAPSAPTGLSASAPTSTTVNLSWNASSDNIGVTGYRIYRNGAHIANSSTTSYSNTGLSGSTTYSYQVRAYDAVTNLSGPSNTATITTPDTISPSTPTNLSASAASPVRINLSWSASTDAGGSGLAGYRIYRNGSHIDNTSGASYASTGLAASTTYSYKVAAYDHSGNTSGQSNTASATTWPAVSATVSATSWSWVSRPDRPTRIDPDVVVTPSGGSGTGYTYTWQYVSGDTQIAAVSPASSSTRWSRSMPYANVTYSATWRCRVTDGDGNAGYSPNVTVTFKRMTIQ